MEGLEKITGEGVLLLWPLIPIFWLPLRFWPGLKERLGAIYFIAVVFVWLSVALVIWSCRDLLLGLRFVLPAALRLAGIVLLVAGFLLQAVTAVRLGKRIVGLPELTGQRSRLETSFPFNLCRHPTYLSHFMMFFGVALATGFLSVFLVAILDLFITLFGMIPLEEQELESRFGDEYLKYSHKTNMLLPGRKKLLSLLFRHRQKT